jgi:MFS family permease
VFFPAKNAILPDIVSDCELGAANALSSATWSVMLALGAAVGGFVAGQWGIYLSFIIDAVTFLVSACFILLIRYDSAPALEAAGARLAGALSQYVDGIKYLTKHADIFMITIQKAAVSLTVGGIFQIVQVILAEQVFVIGEGGSTSLGLQYAIVGVGTGVGPIIARRFSGDDDRKLRVMIAWSYGLSVLGLMIISPLSGFGALLVGSLFRGVGTGINWVFSTQLLLQLVPNQVRGRVFSTEFALFTLGNALAAGLGGWIFDHAGVSISSIMWWITVISAVPGLIWLVWISLPHGRGAAKGNPQAVENV